MCLESEMACFWRMNLLKQEIPKKLYLNVQRRQEKRFHKDDAVNHGFDELFFLSGNEGNIWTFT